MNMRGVFILSDKYKCERCGYESTFNSYVCPFCKSYKKKKEHIAYKIWAFVFGILAIAIGFFALAGLCYILGDDAGRAIGVVILFLYGMSAAKRNEYKKYSTTAKFIEIIEKPIHDELTENQKMQLVYEVTKEFQKDD